MPYVTAHPLRSFTARRIALTLVHSAHEPTPRGSLNPPERTFPPCERSQKHRRRIFHRSMECQ